MGFDIKSFIQDVQRAMGNHPDVKVDDNFSEGEKKALPSIFGAKSMVENAVAKGDLSAADAKAIFGLEISDAQAAKAPRRAGESNGSEGSKVVYCDDGTVIITNPDGTTTVDITNTNVYSVNIDISEDMKAEIEAILNAYFEGKEIDFTEIIKHLEKEMTDLKAYIFELFNQLKSDLNLDNIYDILKNIASQLEQQSKEIGELKLQITGLEENITNLINTQLDILQKMDMKVDSLRAAFDKYVEQYNIDKEEQNKMLALIYDAIIKLTNRFDTFTDTELEHFNAIMDKLKNQEVSFEEVMAYLKLIKTDTSNNCEMSKKIMALIAQGKKEILTAIANLGDKVTEYGDKILNMLENIDVDKIGEKLDDIKALLEVIDATTKDTNKDTKQIKEDTAAILELLKDFPDFVSTIKDLIVKMDGKLDKIREFLVEMEKKDREEYKAILLAIKNLSTKVDDMDKVLDHISETVDATYEIVKELKEKGINVDLSQIITMLETITKRINDLQVQGQTYHEDLVTKYNNLVAMLTNLDLGDLSNFKKEIQEMITEGVNIAINDLTEVINNKEVDFKPILDKMDKILDAIKNHHVEVKIKDIQIINGEDDKEQTVHFTYVNCFENEEQIPAASRRAPGAVTPEQAREYELLLNFGKTSEAELDKKEQDILAKADKNRPSVSGGTSGIAGVEAEQKQSRPGVYTVGGAYVGADRNSITRSGVYIIDGKKVVIKK